MKAKSKDTAVRRGTSNLFADLGYANADTHFLKAGLVSRIQDVLTDRKLTQSDAAKLMGTSQPDVSRLLRGQFRDISVERLMRMLIMLGCEVDIVVRDHEGRKGRKGRAAPAPEDIIRLRT